MNRIRVALLAGGWSGERAVSLKSGEAVFDALDRDRYVVVRVDPRDDLDSLVSARASIDVAINLLHGRFGEDGRMQGMLDILGVPYVGSGPLACALAQNKGLAKRAYRDAGLAVARDVMLRREADGDRPVEDILERLGGAVMVKPISEGSSLGVALCRNPGQLRKGIQGAFEYDAEVMVEEYIAGREVTCCVTGNRDLECLPLIEIVPERGHVFFDYEAKYTRGVTREICPAPLSQSEGDRVRECGMAAHRILQCRVWSRTDMILREGQVYLLETNTLPGMTENSLFPLAAREAGMSLSQLLDRLIECALELKRDPVSARSENATDLPPHP